MAAPDFETLYAIEEALEPELVTLLKSATSLQDSKVMRWLDSKDTTATPRLEVELRLGEPTGIKKPVAGLLRHAGWDAQIIVRCITNQRRDTSAQHYSLIKQVRAQAETWQTSLLIAELPYHALKKLLVNGTENNIEERSDGVQETVTALVWDTSIEIRSDAWPV